MEAKPKSRLTTNCNLINSISESIKDNDKYGQPFNLNY